jgi:hypothetical protein
MSDAGTFDCLLCHNGQDKPAVRALARDLRAAGLAVWLDEERLRPGLPWQSALESAIRASRSIAVLVGPDGLGPWEDDEMQAALSLAVKDKRPVIAVLLPDAPAGLSAPALPLFLANRTWVDLRRKSGAELDEALGRLVWGITGRPPDATDGVSSDPQSPITADPLRLRLVLTATAAIVLTLSVLWIRPWSDPQPRLAPSAIFPASLTSIAGVSRHPQCPLPVRPVSQSSPLPLSPVPIRPASRSSFQAGLTIMPRRAS